MKVKDMSKIREKWKRKASAAGPDYRDGVENPRKDWAGNAADAEEAYEAGVQEAISRKEFGKGVKAAGTAKWQERALAKGAQRFGPGVNAGVDDYDKGFSPYRDELEKVTLPPRGPRGDPNNLERVRQIAAALHKKRTG